MAKTYIEHILHVVSGDERIVDRNNLNARVCSGSTQHKAANAAESIDSDFNGGPATA